MAIEIQQAWEGVNYQIQTGGSGNDTAEVYLICRGGTTEADVLAAVLADETYRYYPLTGGTTGIPQQSVSISERLTEEDWKVRVDYAISAGGGSSEKPANSYTFELTGSSAVVVRSFNTTKFPSSAPAPKAGIRDGEGVEIMVPRGRFSETRHFPDSKVTAAYQRKLQSMYYTTNSAEFMGFAAGEVLFVGASGQRTGNDRWTVTFNFEVDFGETGLQIGDISGVSRGPWEILWTRNQRQTSGGMVVESASAVYAEQVYKRTNFSELGL